jgi:hypothetical protein
MTSSDRPACIFLMDEIDRKKEEIFQDIEGRLKRNFKIEEVFVYDSVKGGFK